MKAYENSNILILKLVFRSLFFKESNGFRNSTFHVIRILILVFCYFPLWMVNHLALLLDEIFYPKYKKLEINKPLFIIGIPRSGTTLLFRSLALDQEKFSYFLLWEILFAPSILQKKLAIWVWKIDRKVKHPLKRTLLFVSARLSKSLDKKHFSRLDLPEEDELILFHIFSTAFITFLFPNDSRADRFTHFEESLSTSEKLKILSFYKKCLQKHLYVYGKNKRFLSKNPTFTAKIPSLLKVFPDAHFIYLQRNPEESISSFISLANSLYQSTFNIKENPLLEKGVEDMLAWYTTIWESNYSKNEKWLTINYEQLISKPREMVIFLYNNLGFELSPEMNSKLKKLQSQQSKRKSEHYYLEIQKRVKKLLSDQEIIYLPSGFTD